MIEVVLMLRALLLMMHFNLDSSYDCHYGLQCDCEHDSGHLPSLMVIWFCADMAATEWL